MLEQFFDNDFKGFREDVMSELNSRIYSAIQEKKQEVAENFFTEAAQTKKKKKAESCTEDDRREAAADFAMKNDFNEEVLDEANGIKGWKHAHSDIMKFRRQNANAANSVELVSLKKDGNESKMHDAKKTFRSEDEAIRHHKNVRELNPTRNVRHNLYVNGEFKGMLGESVEQIDELKKETLGKYIKKALSDYGAERSTAGSMALGSEYRKEALKAASKRDKGIKIATDKLVKGDYQNEETLKEDTAEFLVDIKYPDGKTQKDFRIMGATEEDVKARLNKIFGGISGYSFDNFRLNH